MGRKIAEHKKELAYLLYMSQTPIKEILERTGIKSNATLNKWIQDEGWKEKRAARTVSRTELINKTLGKINELLDSDNKDFSADQLSKMASLIEKLDKQASPVVIMDVFTEFGRWLQNKSTIDKTVTLDFMKQLNRFQDIYITNKLNS
jgi:transposase-like protein